MTDEIRLAIKKEEVKKIRHYDKLAGKVGAIVCVIIALIIVLIKI